MSDYLFSDLLDLPILQKMADTHYLAAGMPIDIIDAIDGTILVGAGWQDICVKYHRANPVSLKRCRESDDYIKDRLVEGEFIRFEATHIAADGTLHDFDFSLKPVMDDAGKVVLLIPEGRDITERKQIEEELRKSRDEFELRVKERSAELKKLNESTLLTNRALEDFSHVASHDLQEPLRKIITFSERLVQ
jgi:hypothetical protein